MKKLLVFLMISLAFSACKPKAAMPKPSEFAQYAKGTHAKIFYKETGAVIGEIIAINETQMVVIPKKSERGAAIIPRDKIREVHLLVATSSDNPEGVSLWAALLNVLPASHGIFAIISIPFNLLTSIPVATDAAKSAYVIKYPAAIAWDEMHKFARFPQGIPETVPVDKLR